MTGNFGSVCDGRAKLADGPTAGTAKVADNGSSKALSNQSGRPAGGFGGRHLIGRQRDV